MSLDRSLYLPCKVGDVSDGYHTFNELYTHRTVLFITLMACNKGISWVSKLHADGTMFDDMIIVGMDLPNIGTVTYHIEDYWFDKFGDQIKKLERAPEWDGHTSDDVFMRLAKFSGQKMHWNEKDSTHA